MRNWHGAMSGVWHNLAPAVRAPTHSAMHLRYAVECCIPQRPNRAPVAFLLDVATRSVRSSSRNSAASESRAHETEPPD